jgi:Na+/melibiose symporter-like transporter
MAACFYLVFQPPTGLSQPQLGVWLFATAVGLRVSMSLFMLPSNALIPELAPGYDDRTSLISWRFLFGWLGGLAVAQIGLLHFFASPDGGASDGRLVASAYRGFGLACGLLVAAAILASSIGTHGLIPRLRSPDEGFRFSPRRFAADVRDLFAVGSYRVLAAAAILASVAIGFNDVTGFYVNTYFWELSTRQISVLVYGAVLSVGLGVAVARPVTERFDKKRSALLLACVALAVGPLPILLRLAGAMPPNGHPLLLPLLLVRDVVLVACMIAIGIITASMLTDVVDESELRSGRRQEGLFMATLSLIGKSTTGLGTFFAGLVLDAIGFPRGAQPGSVAEGHITALGLAVGPGVLGLYLLTLLLLSRFPITRARHLEISRALEARRPAGGASPSPGAGRW